jgi:Uncharacterized protein conserved in bacteria (DUF2252)
VKDTHDESVEDPTPNESSQGNAVRRGSTPGKPRPNRRVGRPHEYFRQLWDWKYSVDVEAMTPETLRVYSKMCGWSLARAHARSGDRVAIASYLGSGDAFDRAIADFAVSYADQNRVDHQTLVDAIADGPVHAELGI